MYTAGLGLMKAAESQYKTSGVAVHRLMYTQQQSVYHSSKDYYSLFILLTNSLNQLSISFTLLLISAIHFLITSPVRLRTYTILILSL